MAKRRSRTPYVELGKSEKRQKVIDAFMRKTASLPRCVWTEESIYLASEEKSNADRIWNEVERSTVETKPILKALPFPYSTAWETLRILGREGALSIFRYFRTGEPIKMSEEEEKEADEASTAAEIDWKSAKGSGYILRAGVPTLELSKFHPELFAAFFRHKWRDVENALSEFIPSLERLTEASLDTIPTMATYPPEIRRRLLEAGVDFFHSGRHSEDWGITKTLGLTQDGLKITFQNGPCVHTIVLKKRAETGSMRPFSLTIGRQVFAPETAPSWPAFRKYLSNVTSALSGADYACLLNNDRHTREWCFSRLLAPKANGERGRPGQIALTIDSDWKTITGIPLVTPYKPIRVAKVSMDQAAQLPNYHWQSFPLEGHRRRHWTQIVIGRLKWRSYPDGSFRTELPAAIQIGDWRAVIHAD